MGKRFKTALIAIGCTSAVLALFGPLAAWTVDHGLRLTVLTVWAAAFGIWVLGVQCALLIYLNRRLMRILQAVRRELRAKNNADVISEVRDIRAKQSRHEYKQELMLDRIDTGTTTLLGDVDSIRASQVVPDLDSIPWHGNELNGPRILFITSNGSGMGHLSRCLAVASEAEKAGSLTAVLTLSTAYEVVRETGYPVMYHPSSAVSPWSLSTWNRSFSRFLQRRLENDRPDLVVFDGTAVYRGVTQVCRRMEIPLVWLRRGMWKDGVSRVQYDRPFEVADYVIVPGEVTGEAPRDQPEISYVGPVSQASQVDILDSNTAKKELGLDPKKQYVLVQVGNADLDGESAVTTVIESLASTGNELTPVVLVSPVAAKETEIPGAIIVHGRYPLAPYLKAFEFGVCSAGYNSVHENLAVGMPAVYIPKTTTITDDQSARADLVAQNGMGLVAHTAAELHYEIEEIQDASIRHSLKEKLDAREVVDGSSAMVMKMIEVINATQIENLHPGGPLNSGLER